MSDDSDDLQPVNLSPDRPAASARRFPLRMFAWGMAASCVLGVAVAIGVIAWLNRGQPPIMKPQELDAAEAHWRQHGSADYDLDLDASLGLAGRMHVEVRKGEVVLVTLNGQPTRRHLWDYWSVPGLFEVMRLDRDRNLAAAREPAAAEAGTILQQAIFDSENGLPIVYRRSDENTGQSGGWRITRFQPLR